MAYKGWKMMDKIDVAVKTSPSPWTFTGYVVEHGDKNALESAKDWARSRHYDRDLREYTETFEPEVYTFDNGGFSVKILEAAQGSSQGGRVSFLACEVEKDGVKFVIGVNDELLVDLIRNSTIINGVIQEKVLFVRRAGRPGFIHEGMDAYKEAVADMKTKSDLKSAKKTSKWELGGVYKTLTQTSICLGEVYDTLEKYQTEEPYGSWGGRRIHNKFRKREEPVKTYAWMDWYNWRNEKMPESFSEILKYEMKDRSYIHFSTGKPPARSKAQQLEVGKKDLVLLDKYLSLGKEYIDYGDPEVTGRYVRELKNKGENK